MGIIILTTKIRHVLFRSVCDIASNIELPKPTPSHMDERYLLTMTMQTYQRAFVMR